MFPVRGVCRCICPSCCWCCNFDIECTAIGKNLQCFSPLLLCRVVVIKCMLLTNGFVMVCPGWTHYILPKFEPSGLLPVPFGRWSSNLHVDRKCDFQDGYGMCDFGLEFVGCISIYEFGSRPKEKSSGTLSSLPHVCICWFPHHCY